MPAAISTGIQLTKEPTSKGLSHTCPSPVLPVLLTPSDINPFIEKDQCKQSRQARGQPQQCSPFPSSQRYGSLISVSRKRVFRKGSSNTTCAVIRHTWFVSEDHCALVILQARAGQSPLCQGLWKSLDASSTKLGPIMFKASIMNFISFCKDEVEDRVN